MKRMLFIAVISLLIGYGAQAQDDDRKLKDNEVPEAVRSSFDQQFDNTMMVEWKMKDGKYKAKFNQGLKKHVAEFSSSGELLSKGEKIGKDDLPTQVSDAVKSGYASSNIDEVYRIEKKGQTYYKVKLDGNPDRKVVYDAQGKVIKEKMD
jgi:hypothetical protein